MTPESEGVALASVRGDDVDEAARSLLATRPTADAAELGEVPDGLAVDNRAFDVTPAALVSAYVTEQGLIRRR